MSDAILILAEHLRGEIAEITYEMLGAGRKMAEARQVPLYAALLGQDVAPLAAKLGVADKVFVIENPQLAMAPAGILAALLKRLVEEQHVAVVLLGGTNVSMGIGSILSARTKLPFVNFCKNIQCAGGAITLTSQLFGGKILSDTCLASGRGIISVYPGAFAADAGKSERAPTIEKLDLPVEPAKISFRKFIEPEAGDVDITKQTVLVAVGRGIQTQDNIALAEDLAGVLGGAVCASRPVIDQGWLPLSRQVGKSGMTVKPRLYVALGVSGAPEHWEGMQAAQLIIAINTDPKAPIFDGAHYGVCGDALELAPVLTDKLKARKA